MRNANSLHDSEGYMTYKNGELVRVMSDSYIPAYQHLNKSGLYSKLIGSGYMVSHREIDYHTIQPTLIPFITYASEWSFNQLKEAALLTLKIQEIAMGYGMTLKDASTNNVQFVGSKPIFIDTSSFEIYEEGQPWQAYGQFCEEFLVPLALGACVSLEFLKWRCSIGLAAKLIPKWRYISGLGLHIYLHSLASRKKTLPKKTYISKRGFDGIVASLKYTVEHLKPKRGKTLWNDYYDKTSNYTASDYLTKKWFIKEAMIIADSKKVLDLGCNRGDFTEAVKEKASSVVALDSDYQAVDYLYKKRYTNVLSLVADLCNPTSDGGWMNQERTSIVKRLTSYKFDMVLALALIHHLCFKGCIPLEQIALLFNKLGKYLLVEFIPENDPQIISMTRTIKTHHPYDKAIFLDTFRPYFRIDKTWELADSKRILYLMRRL